MKTSCFKYYTGDDGVAICLYPPLYWDGLRFPALAPYRRTFFEKKEGKIDEKEYERRYREEVLSKLNPQEIYDTLRNNVLLCWEESGFCHRFIVARWIWENLSIEVPEWNKEDEEIEQMKKDKKINPLF